MGVTASKLQSNTESLPMEMLYLKAGCAIFPLIIMMTKELLETYKDQGIPWSRFGVFSLDAKREMVNSSDTREMLCECKG